MKKILIQDFMAECNKICDDAAWHIDEYHRTHYPRKLTRCISPDDMIAISKILIEHSTASNLDIISFKNGVDRLLQGDIQTPRYDYGIMYATSHYYGGH